jgi:hypothetical protein
MIVKIIFNMGLAGQIVFAHSQRFSLSLSMSNLVREFLRRVPGRKIYLKKKT